MNERKNVLMLITQLSLGGAEKVFNDHLRFLQDHHTMTVCVFTKAGFYEGFQIANPIYELDDKTISNPLQRWQYRRKRLETIIAEQNIDCCISHMEGANILNCMTRSKGVQKILCVHGSIMADSSKSKFKKAFLNKLVLPYFYKKADYVVAVSEAMKAELRVIGIPEGKAQAIPNFFDLAGIQKKALLDPGMPQLFKPGKTLVHVGRLSKQKNQGPLLDIVAALKNRQQSVRLLMAGDGNLRDDLITAAKAKGLKVHSIWEDQPLTADYDVYFLGVQPNPYQFIGRADLFLLTSYFEGFPLVIGETLACGIPVVSVDCHTGPRELLTFGSKVLPQPITGADQLDCGVLLPDLQQDHLEGKLLDEWCNTIIRLLGDAPLRAQMREKSLEKIQQYTQDKIAGKWLQLIATHDN